jgi:hypothetical protein
MEFVELPGTGRATSRIGFGCGRLVGGASLAENARLVEAALAMGIRHFDTAPSYGLGTAENVLGAALAGVTDATIATKVGVARPRAGGGLALARKIAEPVLRRSTALKSLALGALSRTTPRGQFDAEFVKASFEESLRRLRRARVDILLLHEPTPEAVTPPLTAYCDGLVSSGAVSLLGTAIDETSGPPIRFGTIHQCRFDPWRQSANSNEPFRILHGVLRHADALAGRAPPPAFAIAAEHARPLGWNPEDRPASAAVMLRAALDLNPNAIVLVSFKNMTRLKEILGRLGELSGAAPTLSQTDRDRRPARFDPHEPPVSGRRK